MLPPFQALEQPWSAAEKSRAPGHQGNDGEDGKGFNSTANVGTGREECLGST